MKITAAKNLLLSLSFSTFLIKEKSSEGKKGGFSNLNHKSLPKKPNPHPQNHDAATGAISPPQHRLTSIFIINSRHLLHCTSSNIEVPTAGDAIQFAIDNEDTEAETQCFGNAGSRSTAAGSDGGERETGTWGSSCGASADIRRLRRHYRFENLICSSV